MMTKTIKVFTKKHIYKYAIILVITFYFINQNYYSYYKFVKEIEVGEYTVSIYKDPINGFIPHFSSASFDVNATIVLKSKAGKVLLKPTLLCPCEFTYSHIEIYLSPDKDRLYFASPNRHIDLKKMKCW